MGVDRDAVGHAPCVGRKDGDAVALNARGDDIACRKGEAAEKSEPKADQWTNADLSAFDLMPEHHRNAAEPQERAERDARPERLAEEERREGDVGERGKREDDRDEPRHHIVTGVVEEDEVGRIEKETERREAEMRAQREGDRRAGELAD
jgi:hypothetical protein